MNEPRNPQAFVTYGTQTPELGTMPAGSWVKQVYCHVLEAFNSDGSDQITVGWDGAATALCTAIDVSTTGIKTVTMGASNGYNSVARRIFAYYTNGGSEPTLGKAFIWVDLIRVPLS